jgi:hypothetical protein
MSNLESNFLNVNTEENVDNNSSKAVRERKTLAQRKSELEIKLAKLEEKLKSQSRKDDARKKILLGAYVLASGVDLKNLRVGEKSLMEYLSEKDRSLFME